MLYRILIEKHLKEKKIIITDDKEEYTYLQLHKKAMKFLMYMRKCGVAVGDRVLIRNYNNGRTVAAILACLAGGIIFVMVSDICKDEEQEYILDNCSAAMLLDPQALIDFDELEMAGDDRVKVSEVSGAYILYTSGTEGIRKGVLACHRQIIFCCNSILSRLKYREDDRVLCSLPLEFDYGLYQIFLSLISKSKLFLMHMNLIQEIPKRLNKWRITVYPSIPSVVNLLLKMDFLRQNQLQYLRKITFTGEYLSIELIKNLKKALPLTEIIPMYGITECKRVSIMPEGREDKVMAGSCGLPLDGIRVWLDDRQEDGTGELVVEGPNVMEGYWKGESGGFETNSGTGNKRFRTGDLMSMDEEGFLYFNGRCNGLIKSGGYRISEIEIERMVLGLTGIIECAVISIPDEFFGEKIGICVYIQSEKTLNNIVKVMSQNVTYRNRYNIFVTKRPLPKNINGKVDKINLRRMIYEKDRCFFRK